MSYIGFISILSPQSMMDACQNSTTFSKHAYPRPSLLCPSPETRGSNALWPLSYLFQSPADCIPDRHHVLWRDRPLTLPLLPCAVRGQCYLQRIKADSPHTPKVQRASNPNNTWKAMLIGTKTIGNADSYSADGKLVRWRFGSIEWATIALVGSTTRNMCR